MVAIQDHTNVKKREDSGSVKMNRLFAEFGFVYWVFHLVMTRPDSMGDIAADN
jgi:hypothetical protein